MTEKKSRRLVAEIDEELFKAVSILAIKKDMNKKDVIEEAIRLLLKTEAEKE